MNFVKSDFPPGIILVFSGILSRYAHFNECLNRLHVPQGTHVEWLVGPSVDKSRDRGFSIARNKPNILSVGSEGVTKLDRPFHWVWNIQDDLQFPRQILLNLLARDKDFIIPAMNVYRAPARMNVNDGKNKGIHPSMLPSEGLFELPFHWTCGDGGLLLKTHVLDVVKPPYDELGKGWSAQTKMFCDEILSRRVGDAGFSRWVDMDNPMGHHAIIVMTPYKGKRRITMMGQPLEV